MIGVQWAQAGGNTSIVEISSVKSLKLEEGKITIVGTGLVRFPVITESEHQTGSSEILGKKAQWVYAKTTDGVFEMIPYFSRSDIEGVSAGGHPTEELKALSAKWWTETLAAYKKIKVGDRVTIGYQADQRVIGAYQVKSAVGWGSLTMDSGRKITE